MAVAVEEETLRTVVLHDGITAHGECLQHHALDFLLAARGLQGAALGQPVEQRQHQGYEHHGHRHVDGHGRGVVVQALGVEPLVVDDAQLSALLQSGILVVNLVDELLVVAHDVYLIGRQSQVYHPDVGQVHLAHEPAQRVAVPHEAQLWLVRHARHGLVHGIGGYFYIGHGASQPLLCGLVVDLCHDGGGTVAKQLCAVGLQARVHGTHRLAVVQYVARAVGRHVGRVPHGGYYQVGPVFFKVLRGVYTLFHLEAVGYLHGFEDGFQHVYVVTVGLTGIVAELVGLELPVAGHRQRVLFGVALLPLGGTRL